MGDGADTPRAMQDTTTLSTVKPKQTATEQLNDLPTHPTTLFALTRTLRLPITPADSLRSGVNGLLGGMAAWGLGAVGELEVEVEGVPASSGYLVDITVLDSALRAAATQRFQAAIRREATTGTPSDVPSILSEIVAEVAPNLPASLVSLTYRPSPFRSMAIMHAAPAHATLSETFEFAASHRLHLGDLSDEDNRLLFGKCNNPNGHGHNYRIEVAVAIEIGSRSFGFGQLQQIVQREIMQRFDHKHLNLDCAEFHDLNPSVENIARVCHGLLEPEIGRSGARLSHVRVWETDKTSCRYPA